MDLSIVIVNFNTSDCLDDCLSSIQKYVRDLNFEIIVADNASADNSVEIVKNNYQDVILITNKTNIGFGAAVNKAVKIAEGKYVLVLNPDNIFISNCLPNLINIMENDKNIGILSCKILKGTLDNMEHNISAYKYPNYYGEVLEAMPFLNKLAAKFDIDRQYKSEIFNNTNLIDVDWVGGNFLLVRMTLFEDIGGFDENYFMYYEEIDLCLRAKRSGWRVCYIPSENIFHEGQRSSNKFREECDFYCAESQLYYIARNFGFIKSLSFMVLICLLSSLKVLFWSFQVILPKAPYYRAAPKLINHLRILKGIFRGRYFRKPAIFRKIK